MHWNHLVSVFSKAIMKPFYRNIFPISSLLFLPISEIIHFLFWKVFLFCFPSYRKLDNVQVGEEKKVMLETKSLNAFE